MNAVQAWQAALGQLQMEMPKAAFDTWVRDAELLSYEDGSFIIGVQNAYARDWLESRLSSSITRLLTGIMNRTVEVRFTVWQNAEESMTRAEVVEPPSEENLAADNASLNRRYSFTNFVVGASNRLAHAASLAVAEKPAQAYNPLFIYGGSGLGKTHLLHAIGNGIRLRNKQARVLYQSADRFVNEFINESPDALILLKEVADPTGCGVAELDTTGKVLRVVEKPKINRL